MCASVVSDNSQVCLFGHRCVCVLAATGNFFFFFKEALHSCQEKINLSVITLYFSLCVLQVLLESGSTERAAVIRGNHKVKHQRKQ